MQLQDNSALIRWRNNIYDEKINLMEKLLTLNITPFKVVNYDLTYSFTSAVYVLLNSTCSE